MGMAAVFLMTLCPAAAMAEEGRWWPVQSCLTPLCARRVWSDFRRRTARITCSCNPWPDWRPKRSTRGSGEELVWVTSTHRDLEAWFDAFARTIPRSLAIRDNSSRGICWIGYVEKGIMQGYVLYRWDKSPGKIAEDAERPGIDCRSTSRRACAGLLDGVLIDESLGAAGQGMA